MNTGEARLMSLLAPNDVTVRFFGVEGDGVFVALVGPEELHIVVREQLLFDDRERFATYRTVMSHDWFPGCIGTTPTAALQALTERLASMSDEDFTQVSSWLMYRDWSDRARPETDVVLNCKSFVEFAELHAYRHHE